MAGNQLTWLQILGYGTGHVFNDICASMWFTYLLLFFQEVEKKLQGDFLFWTKYISVFL
jgi:hypothetical protein